MESHDSLSISTIFVFDMAIVVTTMWGVQIVHVYCCPVIMIQSGVLPCLNVCHVFSCMEAIHIDVTLLKVQKLNWPLFVIRTVKGHVSTNLPSALNLSSLWKRKVSRSKELEPAWKRWNRPDTEVKNWKQAMNIKTKCENSEKMVAVLLMQAKTRIYQPVKPQTVFHFNWPT